MSTILHFAAINDINGNPQRLYALIDNNDEVLGVWDEGYMGHNAVPGIFRNAAYDSIRKDISVRKYKKLLRDYPSPDYAHSIKGYEHLAELID